MLPVCRQRLSCRTALSVGRSASSVRPGAGASSIRDQPATRSLRTISPARTVPWSKAPTPTYTTTRSFGLPSLSSFLPSSPSGGNESPKRVLTATRTLPYSPALLFKVISSVESYSQFLPFLNESTVTARDPETGYPIQAYLTVGYGPLSETFTSLVTCDPVNWIVEAKSGAKFGEAKGAGRSGASSSSGLSSFFPGATEGIFEYLDTQWRLSPLAPVDAPGGPQTKVTLEVRFEFRNQMHAKIMGAVEGHMASVMIEAFEKRIRETHTQGQ